LTGRRKKISIFNRSCHKVFVGENYLSTILGPDGGAWAVSFNKKGNGLLVKINSEGDIQEENFNLNLPEGSKLPVYFGVN